MIEITPEKLRDFQLCRFLYKRKHVDNLQEKKNLAEREQLGVDFDAALDKTIKWFYFETMSGKIPSFRAMMWKWEKLWFKNVSASEIMTASDHPGKNRNYYNTEANKVLSRFYNTHKNPGEVYMINEHYSVPLTEDTKAVGTIDLVIVQNRQVIIKHVATKGQRAYAKGTENGYKVILDSVAFRHRSGGTEHKVSIDYLKEGKVVDAVVTEQDILTTKMLATEIATCTADKFYPSPGCYFCNQCRFKKDCWTHGQ